MSRIKRKAGAFCLVILILAQLVILAAGVREKLQDDDQMAITLLDFREYQEPEQRVWKR